MKALVEWLLDHQLSISCAESLTGGLFASELCAVPGASQVFNGGVVVYSIQSKQQVLGLDTELIDRFGVVSQEVASQMAEAVRLKFNTTIGVSFTGNAGPEVLEGKAVGEVYMAISYGAEVIVFHDQLKGVRNDIRHQCVELMINRVMSLGL
jgi:PncC family amidohydrolase